jgi:hypothetical protein
MMSRTNYWLDLFTGTTWKEFKAAGAGITGFRKSRWKTVQKIKKGDYLLCNLTGVSRFIGILEVTGVAFQDNSPIWKDEDFPSRLKVAPSVMLEPETAIPVHNLRDQLSFFQNLKSPHAWTGHFRASPAKWKNADGEAVLQALLDAQENPVRRPVDEKKLKYRPQALRAKIGTVTVPASDDGPSTPAAEKRSYTDHTEIQWL